MSISRSKISRAIIAIAVSSVAAGFSAQVGAQISAQAHAQNAVKNLSPEQKQLRAIYQELVEINTTNSVGSCTAASKAMAAHLKKAGFADSDMQVIVPPGAPKKGNLVARYKATAGATQKPLLLLAHIDVVEAKREDWLRDPFKLIEEDGFFYARGSSDDKPMAAIFVANMMRYKQEKLKTKRDIIMALTCDEELVPAEFNGVEYLLKNHRELIDAELALNEGGGGSLDKNGKPVRHGIQAGEKIFQSFSLEVTNTGGHSSVPRKDNAIYQLSDALSRLGKYDFPFRLTPTTRGFFETMSNIESGQLAADMKAILREPVDAEALARLSATTPFYNASLRTTCVATMVNAGHATNALPQRAQANVNCRILPGETVEQTQASIQSVLADSAIKVTPVGTATASPAQPLHPELMKAVTDLTQQMWPGIPVVPTMSPGGTDGRFLNNAGIWTYGVSGIFHYPEGSNAHGLNERLPVKSLYEGQRFLYDLAKRLSQ
ncbi:M20/M25/M40 family metallo-hydrolase [Undibacterium baiyunense]|uniref:M20/M25/M40 family metallo-hydrolase n=1 Tax=Undibacterium baiyunense TaxID=2828731 RepID=A0A941DGX2_9BURK|nr:M20/M25/M40 family metallo-hydrolase [Undibacterium baiyunense]MBR7746672.1 M20/M25/M40 family metallo-hydrolase [Undibacterium baiyunense]